MLKDRFLCFFILLMGLSFLGPFSFAQIEEEHDTKNLSKLLKDYNKDQEKVLKDAETIHKMEESEKIIDPDNGEVRELEEVTKAMPAPFDAGLFKKKIDPKDLKKIKYSEAIKIALAPLQKMSEAELVNLLRENTKGSNSEAYIERFPKLALFTVRLIKDPVALSELARILEDQEKLIRFGAIMITTILVAILLKRFMRRSGRSILEALGFWLIRFLLMSSLRIGIITYFYASELAPTLSLAYKTFF